MFKVVVYRSIPGIAQTSVSNHSFSSPLNWADWACESVGFYFEAVKHGEFTQVIITVECGEYHHEIHIEKIRGKVTTSEFDVTDKGDMDRADDWETVKA